MLSIQAFLMLFTDILTKKIMRALKTEVFLIRFSMISHTSAPVFILHFSYISHDDCIDDGC